MQIYMGTAGCKPFLDAYTVKITHCARPIIFQKTLPFYQKSVDIYAYMRYYIITERETTKNIKKGEIQNE